MKRGLIIFIVGCILLLMTPPSSGFSGEINTIENKTNISESGVEVNIENKKVETIKQLRENINELELEKKQLKEDWQQFLVENGKIEDLLKEDIPEEDEFRLKEIIDLYTVYKTRVDNQLKENLDKQTEENLKKELLRLKQDLYKKLVYFIKVEKLDDFLTYVRWDLEVNEKRKDVSEEITEDKKKLEEKVETIREKIEENKKVLDEKIRIAIEEKLDEKISAIINDPRFNSLKIERKKQLFIITLDKLSVKRQELESITEKTSLVSQKIETFNIIERKLIEVMNGFEAESEQ